MSTHHLQTILLQTIPSPVFYKDRECRYTGCNPAFEKFIGMSRDDIIGKTVFELFPEHLARIYNLKDEALFDAGGVQHYEGQVYVKGEERWVVFDKALIMDEARKEPVGLVGVISDITERVMAVREKEQAEKQLREVQKMEAIGTLVGGIAHDFNNILTAIIGYTDLALECIGAGDDIGDYLEEISTAGKRARNLVAQILTFSRRTRTEAGPVQVHLLIKEALKMLRATIPSSIEIRQDILSFGTMVGVLSQIYQVIINLCTNAWQAMPENGGIMEIRLDETEIDDVSAAAHPHLAPGNYLRLMVMNNGAGTDATTKQRIFDPYLTTKVKEVGSELGLAVVYGIVKSHGGAVTVDSRDGMGTRFTVLFPAMRSDIAGRPVAFPESFPGRGERILFVDDEPALVKMAERMLEQMGYRAEIFTNSIEALSYFKQNPDHCDMVITDMTMPYMTGDELAREIMIIRPRMPVIICTGFSDRIDQKRARAIGVRALMMKPFFHADMARLIREALDSRYEDEAPAQERAGRRHV